MQCGNALLENKFIAHIKSFTKDNNIEKQLRKLCFSKLLKCKAVKKIPY
jgi:hypothetical protein